MGKDARSNGSRRDPRKAKGGQKAVAAARAGTTGWGWWIAGAVTILVLAGVVTGGVLMRSQAPSSAPAPTTVPAAPITTAAGRQTPPPWPAPGDASAAVRAAGLPMLGQEGAVEHIHAHLDVLVNGQPVSVPAGIGIDEQGGTISPVHTHDQTGVIHIESPTQAPFSLAQFFTEWQVALDQNRIGGLTATGGNGLRTYVDGKEVTGNPASIILQPHQEIALVYGPTTAPVAVPGSYQFQPGE